MPLYQHECGACGSSFDDFRPVERCSESAECPKCGAQAPKVLSAARLNLDYPGYECPVTGKWIEGRRQHQENLKRTGCRVLEPGEQEDLKRRKALEEARFDARIEETVETIVEQLPPSKRERLAAELEAGADVTTVRK